MKKKLINIILILVFGFMASAATIEKIELEGNQKVSQDTILFYMKSREKGRENHQRNAPGKGF